MTNTEYQSKLIIGTSLLVTVFYNSNILLLTLQYSGGNHYDWRKNLDRQRGAVFATELKNNSCKIAKWAMTAVLAGSASIKFGLVFFE